MGRSTSGEAVFVAAAVAGAVVVVSNSVGAAAVLMIAPHRSRREKLASAVVVHFWWQRTLIFGANESTTGRANTRKQTKQKYMPGKGARMMGLIIVESFL